MNEIRDCGIFDYDKYEDEIDRVLAKSNSYNVYGDTNIENGSPKVRFKEELYGNNKSYLEVIYGDDTIDSYLIINGKLDEEEKEEIAKVISSKERFPNKDDDFLSESAEEDPEEELDELDDFIDSIEESSRVLKKYSDSEIIQGATNFIVENSIQERLKNKRIDLFSKSEFEVYINSKISEGKDRVYILQKLIIPTKKALPGDSIIIRNVQGSALVIYKHVGGTGSKAYLVGTKKDKNGNEKKFIKISVNYVKGLKQDSEENDYDEDLYENVQEAFSLNRSNQLSETAFKEVVIMASQDEGLMDFVKKDDNYAKKSDMIKYARELINKNPRKYETVVDAINKTIAGKNKVLNNISINNKNILIIRNSLTNGISAKLVLFNDKGRMFGRTIPLAEKVKQYIQKNK